MVHRISLTPSVSQRRFLTELGLRLIESDSPLVRMVTFEIEEGDAAWSRVMPLIADWECADFVRAEFSDAELESASHLQMFASTHGYPQPEGGFGYLDATYDLDRFCRECGVGKIQVQPFRMKGEPRWGKIDVFQLHWVHDALFVPPRLWDEVFRPFGIASSPVIDHRTGKELRSVVQLVIRDAASLAVAEAGVPSKPCDVCGRRKYLPISSGFFPRLRGNTSFPFLRTQECFGSGGLAWNAVLVSHDLYRAISSSNLKGVAFYPVEPSNTP